MKNVNERCVIQLGVPSFAPDLTNAWATVTGQRVRVPPLVPHATRPG